MVNGGGTEQRMANAPLPEVVIIGAGPAGLTAAFELTRRGCASTVLEADTPYIFNCKLFGTAGTIINNEVYSSTRYPGSLGYWSFPTVKPDSADVEHHPFKDEIEHFLECIRALSVCSGPLC